MKELNIYFPNNKLSSKFLPKLLEQISSRGHKAMLMCSNLSQMAKMDEYLWSYEQLSFLPHVTENDEEISESPIVLCTKFIPTSADVLIMVDGLPSSLSNEYNRFSKIIYVCNDNQNPEVKALETAIEGFTVSKFTQGPSGSWSKS